MTSGRNTLNKGFSLLELLIFVMILNIVFVAAISLVVNSMYRMRINVHKARAVFYAEELKEWLNGEREADWAGLQSRAGRTYCVNDQLNLHATFDDFTTGNCPFTGIGTNSPRIYRRRLILSPPSLSQISARIEVSWYEASPNGTDQQYDEILETVYTTW